MNKEQKKIKQKGIALVCNLQGGPANKRRTSIIMKACGLSETKYSWRDILEALEEEHCRGMLGDSSQLSGTISAQEQPQEVVSNKEIDSLMEKINQFKI